jgi:hypothetical protein
MLGSGCFGAGSWHSALRPLLLALCALGFPAATLGSIYSVLMGTWASIWPIETLLFWRSNIEVRPLLGGPCGEAAGSGRNGLAAGIGFAPQPSEWRSARRRAAPVATHHPAPRRPAPQPRPGPTPCQRSRPPARGRQEADRHLLPLHPPRPGLPVPGVHELPTGADHGGRPVSLLRPQGAAARDHARARRVRRLGPVLPRAGRAADGAALRRGAPALRVPRPRVRCVRWGGLRAGGHGVGAFSGGARPAVGGGRPRRSWAASLCRL